MITHLFRLWVLRYHSTLLQHVTMFGPSLRFWFSVWVINFRIIWTYCNTSPKGEVLRGSVTLAALLFKPLCQLPCEHTNPHSRHCQCKTLFSLKPQRSSFAPPLHFFFLLWTQSVSERINKHDCFTKTHTHTHTHTHTDLDWAKPPAYKVLGLLHIVAFDLLLLLPVKMHNIFTFHLCYTSLNQLFWHSTCKCPTKTVLFWSLLHLVQI